MLFFFFPRLNDADSLVRENAIIMLTHLILHDFVRIKSLISEAAKCIADSNSKIASVAKYLFAELSRKVSKVYIALVVSEHLNNKCEFLSPIDFISV